jgi:Spy/CpxP family protein refolding chaperone
MKLRSLLIGGMLLAVALGGAIAVSQNIRKAHYRGEGFMGGRMLEFFADYLDLTDAQQAQAKEIMAKDKPALQPLLRQRIQAEKQLRELAMNGNFDDSKVRDIANQQAQVLTELTVQKTRIESELFQLLTPDQKTKLNHFMDKREQRMSQHLLSNPNLSN